jgi:hypothetical protein
MPGIFDILRNTPLWVFALFALLAWLGIQALRPRTVPLWRLLATPVIFIGWGVVSLALRSSPILIADWLVAALIGAGIAWTTVRLDTARIDGGHVTMPGSVLPLIRNLLIFSAKYAIGVAIAMAPGASADLAIWDIAISGLSAGYFAGWLTRLALAYRGMTGRKLPAPAQP